MTDKVDTFAIDLYNLILVGLIALKSEQNAGAVGYSSSSESVFLGKWLKLAKKQRRFPKSISNEIDNFLITYAKKGISANLGKTFSQINTEYQICNIKLQSFKNSPKKRFDAAIEMLVSQEWTVHLPVKHDFDNDGAYKPTKTKEIFMTEWDWSAMFDQDDSISTAVSLFVASDPQQVIDCLYAHGFILITIDQDKGTHTHFKIFPDNDYKGQVAVPTQFVD